MTDGFRHRRSVTVLVCLCADAVTVVLYNTMTSLSEMEEIPVSEVSTFL